MQGEVDVCLMHKETYQENDVLVEDVQVMGKVYFV